MYVARADRIDGDNVSSCANSPWHARISGAKQSQRWPSASHFDIEAGGAGGTGSGSATRIQLGGRQVRGPATTVGSGKNTARRKGVMGRGAGSPATVSVPA